MPRPEGSPRHRATRHARHSLAALLAALGLLVAVPGAAWALDAASLSRSLDHAMAKSHAGGYGALVRDLDTGETLYERHADAGRIPASVEKLFTTSTALSRFGADARLTTRLERSGEIDDDGRLHGDLILVGAGDPTLDTAALARLARAARRAGIRRVSGSVLGDESYFDDRRGGPRTDGDYDSDMGGVLGALTVGRGLSRENSPALAAARSLVAALRARDIRVLGRTHTGTAPTGSETVAEVRSPTMAELVRRTNVPSDNFYAETLLKDLGATFGPGGTTMGGISVVREQMSVFGMRPTLTDGSGLSRANRVTPRQVVNLLSDMRRSPLASVFQSSLAVAGRTGTLRMRLRGTAAAGVCRGKTGTLNRVSSLVGLCTTRSAHTVAFALLMNDVTLWRAHDAQDRATRAIVGYGTPAL